MGWRAKTWQFVVVPEHSNAIVAIFSGLLFIATTVYAVFAGLQWYITREAMQRDQRALVVIRSISTDLDINKAIVHNFVIENTGRTPARNVHAVFRMEILNYTDDPSFDLSNRADVGSARGALVVPNDPITSGISPLSKVPGTELVQGRIMTDDLHKKYIENKIWLAVVFRMSYQDIFGTHHWLDRCQSVFNMEPASLVSSPSGAAACTDYNKTDEN